MWSITVCMKGLSGSGFHTRLPLRDELAVRQPGDRREHRGNRLCHVGKVDMREIVGRLMVLGMQPEARDRLRDDAAARELDVVRSLEKLLLGMRIGDQACAVRRERL